MNYTAIDELNHFNFHDAELYQIEFHDGSMKWQLSSINATKQNSQNSFDKDMCIKDAVIVFEHVKIEKIVFSAYKVYDSNNTMIKSEEAKTANPDEYDEILRSTLDDYCYIYSMEQLPDIEEKMQSVCFNIDGGAGNFYLTISFSKSLVQWNEYGGKAWYESER